jgi:hypothetical protein
MTRLAWRMAHRVFDAAPVPRHSATFVTPYAFPDEIEIMDTMDPR